VFYTVECVLFILSFYTFSPASAAFSRFLKGRMISILERPRCRARNIDISETYHPIAYHNHSNADLQDSFYHLMTANHISTEDKVLRLPRNQWINEDSKNEPPYEALLHHCFQEKHSMRRTVRLIRTNKNPKQKSSPDQPSQNRSIFRFIGPLEEVQVKRKS